MPGGAIFRPDAEGAFHLFDFTAAHELLQRRGHPIRQVFDTGKFFLPVVEFGIHTVDYTAFRRKHDDHALVTAISGKECLFAFSPCGVVCIVADEAPFLLHHDDVQSCQPFAEVFQALRIGKAR